MGMVKATILDGDSQWGEKIDAARGELERALAIVKAAGYRVTKPKAKPAALGLNAVGKPYGEQFDPNYKMKYTGAM